MRKASVRDWRTKSAHGDFLSQLTRTFYTRKWTFMSTYESFSKSAKECRTVGGFRALDGPVASLPPTVHDFLADF